MAESNDDFPEPLVGDDELDSNEARELLGIHKNTLYQWVAEDVVPYYRVGPKLLRFSRRELLKFKRNGYRRSDGPEDRDDNRGSPDPNGHDETGPTG